MRGRRGNVAVHLGGREPAGVVRVGRRRPAGDGGVGYEDVLLDPIACPNIVNATVLVELHDVFVPGLTERLKGRFSQTHTWESMAAIQRRPEDFKAVSFLDEVDQHRALNELRIGTQVWALLSPHPS